MYHHISVRKQKHMTEIRLKNKHIV